MTRGDLGDLAAALELPSAAAREQRLHLARGKLRARNSGPAAGKLTLTAAVTAAIARQRHGMPCRLLGQLLGVDESTISLATRRLTPLLHQQNIAIAPAGHRIASLDDLRQHAATAGITRPAAAAAHGPRQHVTDPRHTANPHYFGTCPSSTRSFVIMTVPAGAGEAAGACGATRPPAHPAHAAPCPEEPARCDIIVAVRANAALMSVRWPGLE